MTFILEGALVHTDSSGYRRVVEKGGVQWMTAGAGVVHNEQVPPSFQTNGGLLEVLQLWVNLPARLKMTPASYVGVQADGVASTQLEGGAGTLHLVAGRYGEASGPIKSHTDVFMSWGELKSGADVHLPAPSGRTILFYMIRGEAVVGGKSATGGDLVKFAEDGDTIEIAASSEVAFLFAHADPIGEPVVAGGPFVMNSEAEISQAYRDYRAGTFGKPPSITDIG